MSNFLILDEFTYHSYMKDRMTIDKSFRPDTFISPKILPDILMFRLAVVAVVGDNCVQFLKNMFTHDMIMSLKEFEQFKRKYC